MIIFNNEPKTNKFYIEKIDHILKKTKNYGYAWLIHEDFPMNAFYAEDTLRRLKMIIIKIDNYSFYMIIKNIEGPDFLTIQSCSTTSGSIKLHQKMNTLFKTIIHQIKDDAYDNIISKMEA